MKRVRLKDLIELKTETISPKKNDNYFLYSLPSFDNNKNREYLKGGKIQSNKYKVPNRSILFNKLNVRFKRVWKIDNTDNNKICSTEFLPLVVDENKAYYNFCYYLLISENITNFLCNQNANTSGSHKRIDASMLLELEINLPPLETQQKIAKILSDIDDKIEVLHQINDNLAELTKTIYDYWFVQFDFPEENGYPYKSSGGKMVYNEVLKREIPEGWEVKSLGEIEPNIITGKTPPTKDENNFNGNILFITIDDIRQNLFIYNSERTLSEKGANTQRAKFLKKGDICVSCIGTVGVIGIVGKIAQTNQQINSISNPQNFNKYFLLNYLDRYFKDNFTAKKGAVLDNMNKAEFESIIIINPIQNIKEIYYGKVKFLYKKIDTNIQQIQHLQSLRYWLLPMLMNGQVSVE